MISAVSAASSSGLVGGLRCVERCCPKTRQARRSGTPSSATTCSTQARRRAGLRSFPAQPRLRSSCRGSDRIPRAAAGCSQPQALSGLCPVPLSARRTPSASGSRSPPSPRSPGPPRPPVDPVLSAPQPAVAWPRSPRPCAASLPFSRPPLGATPYLREDHFQGGRPSDVIDAGDGVLSLREAVSQSNATPTVVDTINFASSIEGETLTLTQGELQLTQDVAIDGDADNNGSRVTLSGGWSGTEERDGSR